MWIIVATPPFTEVETFEQVTAQVGVTPEGLHARYLGRLGDELRVVTIWESKEHADRFFADQLGPALARVLGPEPVGRPQTQAIEVLQAFVPEPV